MAKAKKVTAPKTSLPLSNFDLKKRYDVYYHMRKGVCACRNVMVKGKRTFEDVNEVKGPFVQYLELEDAKGRTFMLNYLHVFMICEAVVKVRFSSAK